MTKKQNIGAFVTTYIAMIAAGSLLSFSSSVFAEKSHALTLEKIMADPDWLGRSPQNPYWSDDASAIYFEQKMFARNTRQLMKVALTSGETNEVSIEQLASADMAAGRVSNDGKRKVYVYQGDVYLKSLESGVVQPLTSSVAIESQPQFLLDGSVAYRQGNAFFKVDLNSGVSRQILELKFADKPKTWQPSTDFLGAQQRRLFDYIKNDQDQSEHNRQVAKDRKEANQYVVNQTYYFNASSRLSAVSLSPNGRFVFLTTTKKQRGNEKNDNMPRFITEDGYVENEKVRALVGKSDAYQEDFYLIDLTQQTQQEISTSELDGIDEDPLERLKKKAAKAKGEKWQAENANRAVYLHNWFGQGIRWSHDGESIAVALFAYDNKDRWLATIDLEDNEFRSLHQLTDEAWVNDRSFNEQGWFHKSKTFYYLSEESGYSHLYIKPIGKNARQLTQGHFEVSDLTLTLDDRFIYYKANKSHPGIYEVYRVNLDTGESGALTSLGGKTDYQLSPDEKHLLLIHSSTTRPPELFVQSLANSAGQEPAETLSKADGSENNNITGPAKTNIRQLTRTVSNDFLATDWVEPKIIEVPSSQVEKPIYSRLYLPKDFDPERKKKYPAVMFVHGAGYLQNAHQGWSLYFREFMFHTLLTQQGYVVLDMDYRASQGYGRDWRTAIYQQMGTPELVDLLDGKQWLLDHANVATKQVGIYGGSYGGFMTFMALFKAPEAFAAGAALRPVTDWASYNHGYTSNILNTPSVDPDAFNRSSPIEFAEGLNKPLLIAHGMVDDNVFFKDSVRLVQRLIELRKTQWFETALYPIEPHGFREPSSWLDEYTRIYQLFEQHAKNIDRKSKE